MYNPETILEDPVEAFASALWLYMTPHYPKPSAHQVISGLFYPNSYDVDRGLSNDFGTSITMMAQDFAKSEESSDECWTDTQRETVQAKLRASLFAYFSNYLGGLAKESLESMSCATKLSTYAGIGDVKSFWDYSNSYKCRFVQYETEWSIYNPDEAFAGGPGAIVVPGNRDSDYSGHAANL